MEHDAYENQMIDLVNRNAKEKKSGLYETTTTVKKRIFTKTDVSTLRRGLRRTLLALLTALIFALSIFCFITVATETGYLAVFLFLAAIVFMGFAFILLYAQGILHTMSQESNGEIK